MTCVHIHRKIFGFKINPQNTVTLGALHCNEFQPLMRYFCQMKLMMPASKHHVLHTYNTARSPRGLHFESCKMSALLRGFLLWKKNAESMCCKPTQALRFYTPKPSQHLTPTDICYSIAFCGHIQTSSVKRWASDGDGQQITPIDWDFNPHRVVPAERCVPPEDRAQANSQRTQTPTASNTKENPSIWQVRGSPA